MDKKQTEDTQAPASVQPAIAGKVPQDIIDALDMVESHAEERDIGGGDIVLLTCEALEAVRKINEKYSSDAAPISAIPPGYAVVPIEPDITSDEVNQFGWDLLEALPEGAHLNGHAFNNLKPAIHKALCKWIASAPAIQTQAAAKPTEQEKDAARWQEARKYLSIEDIEAWYSREWKGHEPTEFESAKSDAAIDAAMLATPNTQEKGE